MEPATSEGQILRAAADLFATQGFSKTTMAEVAEKACVSKGLPYVYFRSKRDLLEAVQMRAIAILREAAPKPRSGEGGRPYTCVSGAGAAASRCASH